MDSSDGVSVLPGEEEEGGVSKKLGGIIITTTKGIKI